MTRFSTLEAKWKLERNGFESQQAKAIAEIAAEVAETTKTVEQISLLGELKLELMKWGCMIIGFQTIVILVLALAKAKH